MCREPLVQVLSASLVAPNSPQVEAWLEYRVEDPYAVRLVFGARCSLSDEPVVWVFARQLLADGLDGATGLGDVRVWPHDPEQMVVELRSATASALMLIGTDEIRVFLAAAHGLVPPGGEGDLIDWDTAIAELP
ncbi:SsgA family sporulation/cell division regulator [Kitasatospora sp. MMS16-BH015]|uniref:SsgA family sporulation/cell division regulator n=1 Tax=Kitasatospora sp. MMS16-BH015 TaxID=2018025 RepID=UPI000CA21463|nr:SsgA family sporulation/cell division regulator [Kitasatospora sp. MMS16-BH015]AUG81576.1 SsgA family sporulation/cell division regulator [Kitasatospora sp. MMS16-BH015]